MNPKQPKSNRQADRRRLPEWLAVKLDIPADLMAEALWVMAVTLPAYGFVSRLYAKGLRT